MRVRVRFQSLALRDEGNRSTIHFEIEDENKIARAKAAIDEGTGADIRVGAIQGWKGSIDQHAFTREVERVFRDQVAVIARMSNVVPIASCIVALREPEVAIDDARRAS